MVVRLRGLEAMSDHELLQNEKRIYSMLGVLLRDKQLMRVVEHFGPDVLRRSSVLEGFEEFIVANGFKGRAVLEIGSCKGLTALVLARHFEFVYSVDIAPDPQRIEIAEMLGIKNVWYGTARDNAEKAKMIEALQFDAAFSDGDHTNDTEADFALVKRCGRALFHEHWDAQPSVVALVDRLRNEGTVTAAGKWALWVAPEAASSA